jgi:hypothetical protein
VLLSYFRYGRKLFIVQDGSGKNRGQYRKLISPGAMGAHFRFAEICGDRPAAGTFSFACGPPARKELTGLPLL